MNSSSSMVFEDRSVGIAPTACRPRPGARRSRRSCFRRGGFTLVECLATILLISIVLPAMDMGFASTTSMASATRRRTEAAGLAQSKLSELITNGKWQNLALNGDFGNDWPDYKWSGQLSTWPTSSQTTMTLTTVGNPVTMQQLDITVSWTAKNHPESVTVSGLVYVRPSQTE